MKLENYLFYFVLKFLGFSRFLFCVFLCWFYNIIICIISAKEGWQKRFMLAHRNIKTLLLLFGEDVGGF